LLKPDAVANALMVWDFETLIGLVCSADWAFGTVQSVV
jgi:hypothetical protein